MTTSISGSLATTSTTTSTSSAPIVTSSSHATSKSRGHALMLERLWRIKDPSAPEPKPLSRVTTDMLSGNTYDFLSYSDRKLLEKMYTYAEENNINLEQVDALAFDLAGYRMDVASGGFIPNTPGSIYTPDGKWVIAAFDERDTKIAYQIKNGKAALSTQFDHGFLNEVLDPEKHSTHAVDFAFLAKMVKQFSDQAGQPDENIQMPDDPNRRYAAPGQGAYLVETLNGKKPPTHPDNMAKGGDDSTNVLNYLTKQDRKKLLAAYKMLMSLGMSTEQLDQTATRLGATRMREATGIVAPVNTNTSASAGDKATRAYSSQNAITSLLDSLHPANRQKTRQPHMSKVLETLLIAERAEAGQG